MNSVVEDLKRLRRLFKRKQWTKGHFGVTASGKYLGSWDEVPRSHVAGMCLVGGVGYVSRSFRQSDSLYDSLYVALNQALPTYSHLTLVLWNDRQESVDAVFELIDRAIELEEQRAR